LPPNNKKQETSVSTNILVLQLNAFQYTVSNIGHPENLETDDRFIKRLTRRIDRTIALFPDDLLKLAPKDLISI
jgi:hypothetical protein